MTDHQQGHADAPEAAPVIAEGAPVVRTAFGIVEVCDHVWVGTKLLTICEKCSVRYRANAKVRSVPQ